MLDQAVRPLEGALRVAWNALAVEVEPVTGSVARDLVIVGGDAPPTEETLRALAEGAARMAKVYYCVFTESYLNPET